MKILVTYAVEAELAPWWKLRALSSRPLGDWTVHQAQIGRATVDFMVTGMGAENARRAAETAMGNGYANCVSAGFCGAVRPGYAVGDIIVADAVQMYGRSKTIECSKGLVSGAQLDGAKGSKLLISVDQVIGTAEEKARIAPFAAAVDMESYSVLEIAHARRVPGVAIRAVSDTYDQDMPAHVDKMVDERGRLKLAEAARTIARHPLALPALIRLGRHSDTAAQALAHFLEAFIKRISFLTHGETTEALAKVAAQ